MRILAGGRGKGQAACVVVVAVQDFILSSLGYHNWPLGYFARHYETVLDERGRLVLPSHDVLRRGTVVKVP